MRAHAHVLAPAVLALLLVATALGTVLLGAPLEERGLAEVAGGAGDEPTPALTASIVHLDMQAYEPTLAITPAGNLFYVGGRPGYTEPPLYETGVPGDMWIHRSSDGITWTNVTPPWAGGEIIDPYLEVDPDTGRLWRASYQIRSVGGNNCIDLIWTDDEGETWERNPIACGLPPTFHDHESLAAGKPRTMLPMDGYPNVLYLCVNRLEASSCTTSRDGGETFGLTVPVFEAVGAPYGWCGGLHAPVITDAAGRAYLPRMHCGVARIAVSEDDGLTWTQHTIDTAHPAMPSTLVEAGGAAVNYIDTQDVMVQVDEAGDLHAAWVAQDGLVWVSSSRDHGATWSPAWNLEVPGVTAVAPDQLSLAAGAPGKLAFAFAASEHPGGYAGNPTAADWDGATWNLYLALVEDAWASEVEVLSVQVNEDDDPIGMDDCGLHRCTPCPAQDCGGWFDYLDVDLDAQGRPWVAFVDVCHEVCQQTGELDRPVAAVATLTAGPLLR